MEVFVKIWQLEGPKVFYRGYLPTILGKIVSISYNYIFIINFDF